MMYAAFGFAFGLASLLDTGDFWFSLGIAVIWPATLGFMIDDYLKSGNNR